MTLRERYRQMMHELGAACNIEQQFEDLQQAYSQPHRKYHTIDHLEQGLREFDIACNSGAILPVERNIILFEWMYHDYKYVIGAQDNELLSSVKAVQVSTECGLNLPTALVDEDILSTDHKQPPKTATGKVLVDIDLSILGQSWRDFLVYDARIRPEYGSVPDEIFYPRRGQVLQYFLKRQPIYYTEYFSECFDERARENIERLLEEEKRYLQPSQ